MTEKFKLSGDLDRMNAFFVELAQIGIPFKANEPLDALTIALKDSTGARWDTIKALAESLPLSLIRA
jgi:hypothetical protein